MSVVSSLSISNQDVSEFFLPFLLLNMLDWKIYFAFCTPINLNATIIGGLFDQIFLKLV